MQLLYLNGYLFRQGVRNRRTGVLMACSLAFAAYLVGPLALRLAPTNFPLLLVVLFGAYATAPLMWLLSKLLFEDDFRPTWIHGLLFLAIEAVSISMWLKMPAFLYTDLTPGSSAPVLWVFPQGFSLMLMMGCLWNAYRGRQADMIESRRRVRSYFMAYTASLTVLVCITELFFLTPQGMPPLIELFVQLGILVGPFYATYHVSRDTYSLFGAGPRPAKKSHPAFSAAEITQFEATISGPIVCRPDFSLSVLAESLGKPDYLVRAHINQHLGFRNFNAFANKIRIERACRRLLDNDEVAIKVVAFDVGYGSLASFHRAFKELTHMAPGEYRRSRGRTPPEADETNDDPRPMDSARVATTQA